MYLRILIIAFVGFCSVRAQDLPAPDDPRIKSEGLAVGLALGTTIIPIAIGYSTDFDDYWWLAASGFVIGPSTGHFYAGQWGRGVATAGVRAGLLAAGVYFSRLMWVDVFFGGSSGSGNAVLAVTSFLGAFGLALYDLATTEASVRRYNDALNASSRLQFVPYFGAKNKGYGLSFVYRF